MTRTLIILGMHRSGTSCLTGSLQEAGLHLGDVNQKTRGNEKGTRESMAVMELNDAVLASVGAAWDDPPDDGIVWREDHKAQRDQVIKATAHSPVWGFKDPRTLLTFDGWADALPDAKFIATFRDPYAVAGSLKSRDGFPIERGLKLWRAYNERLLSVCSERDVTVVNFDWSPSRYRQGLVEACATAGLRAPANGFKFFETRLRRNESAKHAELPAELRTIHRRLQTAARVTMHRARKRSLRSNGHDEDGRNHKEDPSVFSGSKSAASDRLEKADPNELDALAHTLAKGRRWPEADAAYRAAQDWRRRSLGFRSDNQGVRSPIANAAEARAQIKQACKMLARFGAQYWAADLVGLLEANGEQRSLVENSTSWPAGRALMERKYVPLPAPPSDVRKNVLSVMIPVHNVEQDDWLCEALDSVLGQGLDEKRCEITIVDDASQNPTAHRVAQRYGPRIRYLRNDRNFGLVGNHNQCIAQASGEFVHILHQDDRLQPGFYDALLPVLQGNPDLVAGMSDTGYINDRGRLTSEPPAPQSRGVLEDWQIRLSLQLRIQFPSIIVRRSAYQAVGGFSPSLKFSFDWDMWNRIAVSGPIWFEPKHLAQYRVHQGSATYRFGWLERVQDAMQTVALMQSYVSVGQRPAIAEMGIYKFFERYWTLLCEGPPEETSDDQQQLLDFLLSGWTRPGEAKQVKTKLVALRSAAAG